MTYAELDSMSEKLALNLWDLGLRPLVRVVVLMPNVIEFVYLYFALQKLGAIPICALATFSRSSCARIPSVTRNEIAIQTQSSIGPKAERRKG